jgi:endonuclease YncB( thermonuclease family)
MMPGCGITARAVVVRELDGDTIDVELRLPVRARILDLWCAETRTSDRHEKAMGLVAGQHLCAMLPVGEQVRIRIPTTDATGLQSVFSFGRVLADVWRESDGSSVAETMIKDGMGWSTKEELKAAILASRTDRG